MDWHTPPKDDGGRKRNCPLALLYQVCWVEAIQFKQLSVAPENIEVVDEVDSFVLQVLCSHVFSPSNRVKTC